MKHLLFATLLLLCLNVSAFRPETAPDARTATEQTATTLSEEKFQGLPIDAVSAGHAFHVTIRPGDRTGVQYTIDSRLQPYLVCKLDNGRLTLRFDNLPRELIDTKRWICDPTATVTVRQLKELRAGGAARITLQDTCSVDDFRVKASGAAQIHGLHLNAAGTVTLEASGASGIALTCRAETLDLEASGASKIKASGSANCLRAAASGAAGCHLIELKADRADCSASGASHIDCRVTGELSASASGASHITCQGSPKILKKEASRASSIDIR